MVYLLKMVIFHIIVYLKSDPSVYTNLLHTEHCKKEIDGDDSGMDSRPKGGSCPGKRWIQQQKVWSVPSKYGDVFTIFHSNEHGGGSTSMLALSITKYLVEWPVSLLPFGWVWMRKAQWWERGGTSSTMSCRCLIETCVSAEPLQRLLYRWLDVQFDENPWAKNWILNLEFWGNCHILWPTFQRSPRTTAARCLCALLVPRKLSETYWNILKPSKIPKSHLMYIYTYCMNLYDTVCIYIYTLYIYMYIWTKTHKVHETFTWEVIWRNMLPKPWKAIWWTT